MGDHYDEPRRFDSIRAIKALRWNYRWRGVWAWLRATHNLSQLTGDWYRRTTSTAFYRVPGWRLVLRFPRAVIADQMALAEGVVQ